MLKASEVCRVLTAAGYEGSETMNVDTLGGMRGVFVVQRGCFDGTRDKVLVYHMPESSGLLSRRDERARKLQEYAGTLRETGYEVEEMYLWPHVRGGADILYLWVSEGKS